MEATEKPKGGLTLDQQYAYLNKAIQRHGQAAQIKIGSHIRAITNGKYNNIAVYHRAPDISDEDKHATYKLTFNTITSKGPTDWSKLSGKVHDGAAKAEENPLEEQHKRNIEKVKRVDPLEARRTSAGEAVWQPAADRPLEIKPPEVSDDGHADPITKLIIQLVSKHIKVASGTDEKRVEEIARTILSEMQTDFDEQFKDKLEKHMANGSFPLDRVQKLIDEATAKLSEGMVKRVQLITPDGSIKPIEGVCHENLPLLIQMAQARRVNILMVGPTGSGKTTAAEKLAKALELKFYFNGAIDTEYKLKGFLDAQGRLVSPAFRKAFENGGVYLFDEVDASLPAAVLAFNAALSNHYCDFPDGSVERHKDCIIIAAGNTWMGGGTFDYVGRMKQDAAFADRFATLHWPIDEKMEMAVAVNKEWCSYVQEVRANIIRHGLKVIVSPRATLFGEQLLACGVPRKQVIASCIIKGMTTDQWKAIKPTNNLGVVDEKEEA